MLRPGTTLYVYGLTDKQRELARSLEGQLGCLEEGEVSYLVFDHDASEALAALGIVPSYEASLAYEDWLDAHLEAPLVEAGLTIVPPWCDPPAEAPADRTLAVEPSLVFGTGGHPTTRRCLGLIARCLASTGAPAAVLDLGCGSGVLSLAALRLGAARALGCDISALAVEVARRNARRNGLADRATFLRAPAAELVDEAAALVLANLPPAALGELLGHPSLRRGPRWVIASGMLAPDLIRLRRGLPPGLRIVEEPVDGFWHTALIERD